MYLYRSEMLGANLICIYFQALFASEIIAAPSSSHSESSAPPLENEAAPEITIDGPLAADWPMEEGIPAAIEQPELTVTAPVELEQIEPETPALTSTGRP